MRGISWIAFLALLAGLHVNLPAAHAQRRGVQERGFREQPRLETRPAFKAQSLCLSRFSARTSPLYYPKPQYASCDAIDQQVTSNLTSNHYRSACQNRHGGPKPGQVLGASVGQCTETDDNVIVEVDICCPNPCKDLSRTDCRAQSVCDWGGCTWVRGSLTCADLSGRGTCGRYDRWCNWERAACVKDPTVLAPFECNDLNAQDCRNQSECSLRTECRWRSGSLTCRDLNHDQCTRYGRWCRWRRGKCRKRLSQVATPFECNDLNDNDCRAMSECSLRTRCRRRSGSLTCNDLNPAECGRYERWCDFKPDRCVKDPLVLAPFECNDLQQADCTAQSSCSWQERCFYKQ